MGPYIGRGVGPFLGYINIFANVFKINILFYFKIEIHMNIYPDLSFSISKNMLLNV